MPTYEYYCRICQKSFTQREKIAEHDATAVECPACHARNVELVISGFYARTPRKS